MADPPPRADEGVVKPAGAEEVKERGGSAPATAATDSSGTGVDSGPKAVPKGKPGGLRKRKRVEQSAGSDDEDEGGGVNLEALRELREEQKVRGQTAQGARRCSRRPGPSAPTSCRLC